MVEGMKIGRARERKAESGKGSTALELLAQHGPVEVTRYRIAAGKHFYLDAQDEWAGFEFIYVLEGRLVLTDGEEQTHLSAGDYFYHTRGRQERVFQTDDRNNDGSPHSLCCPNCLWIF